MAGYVTVCKTSELTAGRGRLVQLGGHNLALFKVDGEVFAVDNQCRHRGGPLHEGEVFECAVVCPWHGWEYDLRTGNDHVGRTRLDCYPVRIEGDEVQIALGP